FAYCKCAHALSSSGVSQSLKLLRLRTYSSLNDFLRFGAFGAAKILISPLTAFNSTVPVSPLSSSNGLGMRTPFEFPIVIIAAFIVITLYLRRLLASIFLHKLNGTAFLRRLERRLCAQMLLCVRYKLPSFRTVAICCALLRCVGGKWLMDYSLVRNTGRVKCRKTVCPLPCKLTFYVLGSSFLGAHNGG